MAKCFVLRTKKSYGKIPKGYTIQVVTNNGEPHSDELKNALMKEGFSAGDASMFTFMSHYEIISKS